MNRASAAVGAASDKIQEQGHRAAAEADMQAAKNPNLSVGDRMSAAWDATKHKAQEMTSAGSKQMNKEESGLASAERQGSGLLGAAQHGTQEAGHRVGYEINSEAAKSENLSLGQRAQAAMDAVKHKTNEVLHSGAKNVDQEKARRG